MKVAMISPHKFVWREKTNGWKSDGTMFLLQSNIDRKLYLNDLERLIDTLPMMDRIVFYVGSWGAKHFLGKLRVGNIAPDRVVFVCCNCDINLKKNMLREYGFGASLLIRSECGGQTVMSRIYQDVIANGRLPLGHFALSEMQ